jgi:hypothetical protein
MAKATKRHRETWTDKDIGTLVKMAATESVGFVADALQRTAGAVRAKAGQIGAAFGGPKKARTKPATRKSTTKKPKKATKRTARS